MYSAKNVLRIPSPQVQPSKTIKMDKKRREKYEIPLPSSRDLGFQNLVMIPLSILGACFGLPSHCMCIGLLLIGIASYMVVTGPNNKITELIPITESLQPLLTESTDPNDIHAFQHAYSIWFTPPPEIKAVLQGEIDKLAKQFSGTRHEPHVTLYGAIYTTNTSYVTSMTQELVKKLKNTIVLRAKTVKTSFFKPQNRWRSHISIQYENTPEIISMMKLAAQMFNATDVQRPHTTLLYDYTGKSTLEANLNSTIFSRICSQNNLTWSPTEVHVVYTPLRPQFKSVVDMQEMVLKWRKIVTYKLP